MSYSNGYKETENFQYDGVNLPEPDFYHISIEEVGRDLTRLLDTGEMIGTKIGYARTVKLLYKKINANIYNKLVEVCVMTKGENMFHTLRTLDNKNQRVELEVYRSSQFDFEPNAIDEFDTDDISKYERIEDVPRVRVYTDVQLEFISKKLVTL